ncbi:MAG TPA: alpha/beta fold hydrolase [Solirubrobacteraceae bacterium]|jgi:pimeloyl-ACP methyl ester carboxylesterase|nr:alpha/beta fold hydrolase [Solirubrobacteraceae bacterium]
MSTTAPTGPATRDEVVPFTAGDGVPLNLIHVRGKRKPAKPPVLLVHGAGVRANIFRAPSGRTLVDELVDEGYDVWLENWRASIDIPRRKWTLDDAAIHDHPVAVRTVLEHTKADEVRAVIHCQGSTSFMMSAVAGLVPDVSVVVSNAVSLHPVVNRLAKLKLQWLIPPAARVLGYLNPQWGVRGAPWLVPKLMGAYVAVTHRQCSNMVCKWSSYTYGTGEPTLWRHENLNRETHDWLSNEFADVPLTFFQQILASVEAGHLVRADDHPALPHSFVDSPPKTDARFAFFAGSLNACFEPESQTRTHAWFEQHDPGRHTVTLVPNYGHLDIFMGSRADRDVFPDMLSELERT